NSPQIKRKSSGCFKMYNALRFSIALLAIIIAGCKKDDFKGEIVGLCPVVVSTDPTDKAVDVALAKLISATFNSDMDPATINKTTFTIKQGNTLITGAVAPTASAKTFTFKPDQALLPFTKYTGTITTEAKDPFHTAMVNDYVWTFTTIPEVILSSNPAAGGTLNGAGTFAQGSTVTVTATPIDGYSFTNWTEDKKEVSTSASYQFTMAGNKDLVANYSLTPPSQLAVVLSSNPVEGGTTNGAGNFNRGASVTVTANPNAGYTFLNWTENGNIASTNASYQFVLSSDRTLVANYKVIPASQLQVALSSSPAAGGTTSGEGSFGAGSSVTVNAVANASYNFVNWTENGNEVSTSASYTFALNANKTLVANFAIKTYSLTVTAPNGTVLRVLDQARYNHGATVVLTATPNTGFTFTSWTGDATGDKNPLTVTMNEDKNITANFTAIPVVNHYTLTVTAINGKVVEEPNLPNYNAGTNVQLTATANPGYTFTSWSGDATGTVNPLTVTMNGNKNITANFTANPSKGPVLVDLGNADKFTILTKSGITNVSTSAITGNIGTSPVTGAAITGLSCPEVTGTIYTIDAAGPECRVIDKTLVDKAVADMQTAFTTANGLTTPAPIVEYEAGNLNGQTLAPGLYKWGTNLTITDGITLNGNANDTWIFQISQDLVVNNSAIIHLTGGAKAKNIQWIVTGKATLGTNADFSGILLSQTLISLNTGAKVTGKLLAQTEVTLIMNTVKP
ncbi:MAG: cell wall/surface repeat protein, partial [Adhaeribacter sp.]|nr:cell wall/surface repeat protein [Adhaeribacter sp.]